MADPACDLLANEGALPSPRVALIESNLTWARTIAKSIYMRARIPGLDWEDYVQAATIGLIEAADRFDAGKGVCFQAFAIHRVRGGVFDSLREFSRSPVHAAYFPTVERLDSIDEDDEAISPIDRVLGLVSALSIGYLLEMGSMPLDPSAGCEAYGAAQAAQTEKMLSQAVDRLPERERLIVTLHYYQHMPFIEIAEQFGLTKGRISQLHKRAMTSLRAALRRLDPTVGMPTAAGCSRPDFCAAG